MSSEITTSEKISTKQKVYITIGVLLVASALGTRLWKSFSLKRAESVPKNIAYITLSKDPTFSEASKMEKSGNFKAAFDLYQKVPTSNQDEYSFIQYNLAAMKMGINQDEGVDAFMKLVASSSINKVTKAYSINAIAREYSSTHDLSILERIKADRKLWDGYDERLVSGLYATTSTPVIEEGYFLELGSSQAPIMDTEMRLAHKYATLAAYAKRKQLKDTFDYYRNKSLAKLAYAEEDKNDTRISENLTWMMPSILNRKAMVLGTLRTTGEVTEDPEVYFKQAMNSAITQGDMYYPFIRYHYASYLIRTFGDKRKSDVIVLLQPIVENWDSPALKDFKVFTKEAFDNNERASINEIKKLARAYAPFKEALEKK